MKIVPLVIYFFFLGSLLGQSTGRVKEFFNAVEEGDLVRASQYIKWDGNVNVNYQEVKRDGLGITPLHTAASQGDTAMMALLIQRGANVNSKAEKALGSLDFIDATPLHFALIINQRDINKRKIALKVNAAKYLIVKGANVNAIEKTNGMTPLHYASIYGDINLIKFMIHRKANINAKTVGTNKGLTPLMALAVRLYPEQKKNYTELIKLFLNSGVDIQAKTEEGLSALELAQKEKNVEMIKALEMLKP